MVLVRDDKPEISFGAVLVRLSIVWETDICVTDNGLNGSKPMVIEVEWNQVLVVKSRDGVVKRVYIRVKEAAKVAPIGAVIGGPVDVDAHQGEKAAKDDGCRCEPAKAGQSDSR